MLRCIDLGAFHWPFAKEAFRLLIWKDTDMNSPLPDPSESPVDLDFGKKINAKAQRILLQYLGNVLEPGEEIWLVICAVNLKPFTNYWCVTNRRILAANVQKKSAQIKKQVRQGELEDWLAEQKMVSQGLMVRINDEWSKFGSIDYPDDFSILDQTLRRLVGKEASRRLGLYLKKLHYGQPPPDPRSRSGEVMDSFYEWTQSDGKCFYCGRRLKYANWIVSERRMPYCRACGREQPSKARFLDVVNAMTEDHSIPTNTDVGEAPFGQCTVCAQEQWAPKHLQLSRDRTKIFCRRCASQWPCDEVAHVYPQGIPEELEDWMPIGPDRSETAQSVGKYLSRFKIDVANALMVVVDETEAEVEQVGRKSYYRRFIAVHADETWEIRLTESGADSTVSKIKDLMSDRTVTPVPVSSSAHETYSRLMMDLANMHVANEEPWPEPDPNSRWRPRSQRDSSLEQIEALERLADLLDRGIITQDEFETQKARVLDVD